MLNIRQELGSTAKTTAEAKTCPLWKEYLEKNALKNDFLTGQKLTEFLTTDETRHKDIIKEAGFLAAK